MRWLNRLLHRHASGPIHPLENAVRFSTDGWTLKSQSEETIIWRNEWGDGLSLQFYEWPPDLLGMNEVELRDHFRQHGLKHRRVVISCDLLNRSGIPYVRTVMKFRRHDNLDFAYSGNLFFLFHEFWYLVSVHCENIDITGMRHAVVTSKLLDQANESGQWGKMSLEELMATWYHDRYHPELRPDPRFFNDETRITLPIEEQEREYYFVGDAPEYDDIIPHEPLSRLRRYLSTLERTLELQGGQVVRT